MSLKKMIIFTILIGSLKSQEPIECVKNEITCDENKCVPSSFTCDGVTDCDDGTDELNCPTVSPDECQENEFQCSDLNCIDEHDRCNGIQDCADNSDEHNCERCGEKAFFCRVSHECITDNKQCDGEKDCEDESDEEGCEGPAKKPISFCVTVKSIAIMVKMKILKLVT